MKIDTPVVEIIPVNQYYHIEQDKMMIHFARLRELYHAGKRVSHILFLSFQEEDKKFIELLKGSLQLLEYQEASTELINSSFPQILGDIEGLRLRLETKFQDYRIFLNCTPFSHHFHAFLLRDGLNSSKYDLFTYEIFNPRSKDFDYVIIPHTPKLTLDDWTLMRICLNSGKRRMTLREYMVIAEGEISARKKVRYMDQKLRKRLNNLVDNGLMDVEIGQNGEKIYNFKDFKMEI